MKRFGLSILGLFVFAATAWAQAPTLPPSGFNVSARTTSSITVSWTNGGADANRTNYLILANTTGTFTDPTNGAAVTNDVDLTDGSAASYGTILGSATSFAGFTVNANTQYFFRIIPYNAGGTTPPQYYLTTAITTSGYTLATEPTTASTSMTFTSITASSMTVGLSAGNGSFRLLVARSGSAVSFTPTDGTSYTVDNNFTTSTDLGSGNKIVGGGAGNSFNVTGLSGDQVYHFAVFEFNGTAGTTAENYFATSLIGNRDTEPNSQASALNFSAFSTTGLTLSWTNGNGSRRVVLIHEGAAVNADPADATSYTVSANWNSGSPSATQIGTGNYIVYDGTGSSVAITNLISDTQYHFAVYEYNGAGLTTSAYMTPGATANRFTLASQPNAAATAMTFSSITGSSITVGFTAGNGNNRIVVARSGSAVSFSPTDGTSYAADNNFSTATDLGSGNKVVYNGNGNSVNITNLSGDQVYHFAVFEYNGTTGTGAENYFNTSLTGNRDTEPTSNATALNFTGLTATGMQLNWTSGNGSRRVVLIHEGAPVDADPVDFTSYTVSANWNSGSTTATEIGTGNFIVYDGTGTSVTMTNLISTNVYHFAVYEYNGAGLTTSAYLTPGATANHASLASQPASQSTAMTFSAITGSSITVGMSAGPGAFRLLVARQGAAVSFTPVDGTSYTVDPNYTTSTDLGSGNKIVGGGAGNSFVVSGLNGDQVYHFAVYEFNGTAGTGSENYLTATPLIGNRDTEPTSSATALNFSAFSTTGLTLSWTNGNGSRRLVLIHEGAPVDADPVDFTTYTVSANWNNGSPTGTQIGTGNYVVFDGTGTSVAMTNLINNTVYHFAVYEYNGAGMSTAAYLTPGSTANRTTLATLPANSPTSLVFSNVQANSMDLTWTASSGSPAPTGYIVLRRVGASPTGVPTNGTTYSVGNVIGDGTVAYVGSAVTFNDNPLLAVTDYYYDVIAYSGSGASTNYRGSPLSNNQLTPCLAPTVQASAITFGTTTASSIVVNWTRGNGNNVLVLARDGVLDASGNPSSGTTYTANNTFGSGTNIAIPGNDYFVVYSGTGTTVTVNNLSGSTSYNFKVYEWNTANSCYMLTSVPNASQSTAAASATTTITAGTGVSTISSLVNTSGAAVGVFSFTLTDVGGDGTSTRFSQIVFRPAAGNQITDLTELIAGAQLFDNFPNGGVVPGDHDLATITSNSIIIPNIDFGGSNQADNTYLGCIVDNTNKVYTLKVWLKTSLGGTLPTTVDGLQLELGVVAADFSIVAGKTGILPGASARSGPGNGIIGVIATKIDITTGPSTSAFAAVPLSTQPIFEARDANNNRDLGFNQALTVVTSNPTNLGSNSAPAAFASGVADFTGSGFNFPNVGTSTMEVTTASINSANSQNSAAITVLGSNESTVVENTGFTYPTNIDYTQYQQSGTLVGATTTAIRVGEFVIHDGGADDLDPDGLSTIMTNISFNITNPGNIRLVGIDDGTGIIASAAPVGSTVSFSGLSITAPEATPKTFAVYVSFNTNVVDNQHFALQVATVSQSAAGSQFAFSDGASGSGGASTSTTVTDNKVVVTATEARFGVQPSNTDIGIAMSASPTIRATDALGSTDTDYADVATLTSTGVLSTVPTAVITSGVGTFSSIIHSDKATLRTLTGTIPTLPIAGRNVTSSTFDLTASSASNIIRDTGFSEPTDILYANFQAADITGGANDIAVAQFIIQDGGGSADGDGAPTLMSSITMSISNSNQLRSVALYNGAVELGEVAPGPSVTFSNLNAGAGFGPIDNGNQTFQVRVSFINTPGTLVDNTQFQFTITNTATTVKSSDFTAPNAGGNSSSTTGNRNKIEVVVSQLVYTTQWAALANQNYDAPVLTSPILQARDANNIVDLDYALTPTVSSSITLANTTLTNTSGTITFPASFQFTSAGSGADGATASITVTDGTRSAISNLATINYSHFSDFIRDVSFNYASTVDLPYHTMQSTNIINDANSIVLERFLLRDGGGAADPDGTNSELTALTLDITNWQNLRQIALYNGATEVKELNVAANITPITASVGRITFNSFVTPFVATDNLTQPLSVRVSFLGNGVVDNQVISFSVFSLAVKSTQSSQLVTTSPVGISSTVSGNQNRIEVTATSVDYTSIAASAYISADFTVTVEARDGFQNRDLDFIGTVSTVTTGTLSTNPSPITSGAFAAGVKSFTFKYLQPGDGTIAMTTAGPSISGTSPFVDVQASSQSTIALTGAYNTRIDYINHQQASNPSTFTLATFTLQDGPTGGDLDAANTVLKTLNISLTNSSYVKRIAIYNQAGTLVEEQAGGATVNFGSVTSLGVTALDDNTTTFTIRASFNSGAVVDLQNIQLTVTAATTDVGSNFLTGAGLVGGAPLANRQTPATGVNIVDVVATQLLWNVQPPANAGTYQPVPLPPGAATEVHARDANNRLDLEFTNGGGFNSKVVLSLLGANPAQLQSNTFDFAAGIATITPDLLVYTKDGNGTITANSINPPPTAGATTPGVSTVVNVYDVTVNGIDLTGTTNKNLAGGSVNKIIYGAKFNTNFAKPGVAPILRKFRISFDQTKPVDITTVLQNVRIYEQQGTASPGSGTDITGPTIKGFIDIKPTYIEVDFTKPGGVPRDLTTNTFFSYFLTVDIATNANSLTPPIIPYIEDLGWDFLANGFHATNVNIDVSPLSPPSAGGGHASKAATIGQTYSFASIYPPKLVSSVPAQGSTNVDPNRHNTPAGDVTLVFDVPVWSLDRVASLYITNSVGNPGTKVGDMALTGLINTDGNMMGTYNPALSNTDPLNLNTLTNTLKFVFPTTPTPLPSDTLFYVTLAPATIANPNVGVRDQAGNLFPGITSPGAVYFKTSSNKVPRLLSPTNTSLNVPQQSQVLAATISLNGATVQATFDRKGTAYFAIVDKTASGAYTPPSRAQILGTGNNAGGITGVAYAPVVSRGSFPITQVAPVPSYGVINSSLINSHVYDVWVFAVNDAMPTQSPTTGPFGPGAAFTPVADGTGTSTFNFTASNPAGVGAIVATPTYVICPGTFQAMTNPIRIIERNNNDLQTGTDFNLILPIGFSFDTSIKGTVAVSGSDITPASGDMTFLSNSVVKITWSNVNAGTAIDEIIISGIRVFASGLSSGNMTKLGGTVSSTVLADSRVFAVLNTFAVFPPSFTNSLLGSTSFLPDQYDNPPKTTVQLIPQLPTGDYGPSSFSGAGVNGDLLALNAVPLGQPFAITITHTDNNGCVISGNEQYLVYDHNTGLGIQTSYCVTDSYFPTLPSVMPYATADSILYNAFPGFYLQSVTADTTIASPFLNGTNGTDVAIFGLPHPNAGYDPGNNPVAGQTYYSFGFDIKDIASTPWHNFTPYVINPGLPNQYYNGGSLGFVVFEGRYQSIANSVLTNVPLTQSTEVFAPAIIYMEPSTNYTMIDPATAIPPNYPTTLGSPGTYIFCENGGDITIFGFPAASQTATGTFQIYPAVGTTPLVYPIGSFKDNGNGTATLKPLLYNNGYQVIKVVYTFQDNLSPCISQSSMLIRISPNPIAKWAIDPVVPALVTDGSCVGQASTFNGTTSDFGTAPAGPYTVSFWSWDFGDPANSSTGNENTFSGGAGVADKYPHIYAATNNYDVSLTVRSTDGCSSINNASRPIRVGVIPNVAFSITGVSGMVAADPITFTNQTVIAPGPGTVADGIQTIFWEFNPPSGLPADVSNLPAPSKVYATSANFKPRLTITSNIGCQSSLIKDVITLPYRKVDSVAVYIEGFEANSGNWQPFLLTGNTAPGYSWAWGGISGSGSIQMDPINQTKVWKTNLNGSYNPGERSALYSPSFDLSALKRPMISIQRAFDINTNDGVVLQYSVDNLNAADPAKVWTVLGGIDTGTGWYQVQNIASKPGDQPSNDFGWNGDFPTWTDSKHALVNAANNPLNGTNTLFRFALGSSSNSSQGFALDNVRVGERTRTILLESFVNTANTSAEEKVQADAVKKFNAASVGLEVVKLNYHVSFPGNDPFNRKNPGDVGARALYYGITTEPSSIMDGRDNVSPFTTKGQATFKTRSLALSQADITILPDSTVTPPFAKALLTDNGEVRFFVKVKSTAASGLDNNTTLHIAMVEQFMRASTVLGSGATSFPSGEDTVTYVVKKLLPDATGMQFTKSHPFNFTRSYGPFVWVPEPTSMYAPNTADLSIAVFLQNSVTKEIYQSEIFSNLNDPTPNLVTGLEPIPAEQVAVYPVPTDHEMTVLLPGRVTEKAGLQLIDQLGRVAHDSFIPEGADSKTISTSELAAGVYILQIQTGPGAVTRKKVMVVH